MSAATIAAFWERDARRSVAREARVTVALAAYACADDVPAVTWDAAVAWAARSGACFADIAADVAAVAPDGWDADEIDAHLDAAVQRAWDDYYDGRR